LKRIGNIGLSELHKSQLDIRSEMDIQEEAPAVNKCFTITPGSQNLFNILCHEIKKGGIIEIFGACDNASLLVNLAESCKSVSTVVIVGSNNSSCLNYFMASK
jgi:hypothetical protein